MHPLKFGYETYITSQIFSKKGLQVMLLLMSNELTQAPHPNRPLILPNSLKNLKINIQSRIRQHPPLDARQSIQPQSPRQYVHWVFGGSSRGHIQIRRARFPLLRHIVGHWLRVIAVIHCVAEDVLRLRPGKVHAVPIPEFDDDFSVWNSVVEDASVGIGKVGEGGET